MTYIVSEKCGLLERFCYQNVLHRMMRHRTYVRYEYFCCRGKNYTVGIILVSENARYIVTADRQRSVQEGLIVCLHGYFLGHSKVFRDFVIAGAVLS